MAGRLLLQWTWRSSIENSNASHRQPIVILIVGPTGIGKTYLSTLIGQVLPVEIVSADSRQLYRFMDIGTAKPEANTLKSIPHHMINILRPDEYFSAGSFSRMARAAIDDILNRHYVPLVVGGSGLYVKSLVDGLVNIEVHDKNIRKSLRQRAETEGLHVLYSELQNCDPDWAAKIEPGDKQRILRGLEVYLASGKLISKVMEQQEPAADFFPVFYGLRADRDFIYQRINQRVDKMFADGLLAEVINLKKKGYGEKLNAMNTVGYKECFAYLNNQLSYDEMLEQIKKNSRHYAKRQMTWFNRDPRIHWIDVDNKSDYLSIANRIAEEYIHMTK